MRVPDIDLDEAARMLEGNYLNQLYLTQLVLPGMLNGILGKGCI